MGRLARFPVPPSILVVDDEPTPRMAIADALNMMGYRADEAGSGTEALAMLARQPYDLVLLDLRMPGMDGVEVMRRARIAHDDLLVIVLTAYGSLDSAIEAVRAGAADYLLKPISIRDTEDSIARALLRRSGPLAAERFLRRGHVTLDREKNLAFLSTGQEGERRTVDLTVSETALLARLMRQPTRVLSCRDLARDALNYDVFEREAQEIVRPHISRLRQKLESDPAEPRLIHTIRGKGYMFSAS